MDSCITETVMENIYMHGVDITNGNFCSNKKSYLMNFLTQSLEKLMVPQLVDKFTEFKEVE